MSCQYNNSMYTTIAPEEEYYWDDDIYYLEEDSYQQVEEILFNDEINEEEIQKRAEEAGVYFVSPEDLLEFSTAAEISKKEGA